MSHLAPIYAVWDDNAEAMGADIGEPGVKVRQWRNRESIPPEYWDRIIRAAGLRGRTLVWRQFIRPTHKDDHRSADEARTVLCALCERRVDRGVLDCHAIDCPHTQREAA